MTTIQSITDLFDIRDTEEGFVGFLAPSQDYVHAYQRAALRLEGRVRKEHKGEGYSFFACFESVDDSGLSFFGPVEDEQPAKKRLASFREFVEESHPMMPAREAVLAWCKLNGVHPDFY